MKDRDMLKTKFLQVWLGLVLISLFSGVAQTGESGSVDEVGVLQQEWEFANFRINDEKEKVRVMEKLVSRARLAADKTPGEAEVLVWKGIILSTFAGVKGGLGALSLVKEARQAFEQALMLDENVMQGAAHTSLGSLYYQVPGWPLSFGDSKKAEMHLQAGLRIAPDNIDALYFYSDFLASESRMPEAKRYMEKVLSAPARPGRELTDLDRREKAHAFLELQH